MEDIQLVTGCSRTVVRSNLVDKKIVDGKFITMQCAHSDNVILAQVKLQVEGKPVTVEAAVSDLDLSCWEQMLQKCLSYLSRRRPSSTEDMLWLKVRYGSSR